jgi:S1/P1 nuclease
VLRIVVTSLLILWLAVSPALAWSLSGHKITASIACRQLTPDQQAKIVANLKRHPRFTADFSDEMPAEVRGGDEAAQNEWIFQQAAIWPDFIRSGAPEKTAFSRPQWHYINLPIFLNEASRAALEGNLPTINVAKNPPADATLETQHMNILQALGFARKQLERNDLTPQDRGVLTAWAFHLVGDIHQPLHSSTLVSQKLFPEGDRGGNSIKLKQGYNLHALWDGFPGEAMEFRVARNRGIEYAQDPNWRAVGKPAAQQLSESQWLAESEQIARTVGYDNEILAVLSKLEAAGQQPVDLELRERYLKTAGPVAERRLVEAGYRLGAVLKQIAGNQQ